MKKQKDTEIIFKNIAKLIILFSLVGIICVIFVDWLIPLVLLILNMFLALSLIYPSLDINFKFIGGFIFLYVYYKIFCAISGVIVRPLLNLTIDLAKKISKWNQQS